MRLSPRKSFERWREVVRDRSRPWRRPRRRRGRAAAAHRRGALRARRARGAAWPRRCSAACCRTSRPCRGWQLTAHYEPAAGGRIGGDWYDAFRCRTAGWRRARRRRRSRHRRGRHDGAAAQCAARLPDRRRRRRWARPNGSTASARCCCPARSRPWSSGSSTRRPVGRGGGRGAPGPLLLGGDGAVRRRSPSPPIGVPGATTSRPPDPRARRGAGAVFRRIDRATRRGSDRQRAPTHRRRRAGWGRR